MRVNLAGKKQGKHTPRNVTIYVLVAIYLSLINLIWYSYKFDLYIYINV